MQYIDRTYRRLHRQRDLKHFQVAVKETDLDIAVTRRCFNPGLVDEIKKMIEKYRRQLEKYIQRDPEFAKTLTPHKLKPGAPPMAREMAEAARLAGVGPMAAVAGTFAQYVGRELSQLSSEVIIENGGDIFLLSAKRRYIGIFAAQSPFSNRMALEIQPEQTPLGICTSSGTVGHSLSFGSADAVVVLSSSAILADAVATAAANMVKNSDDLKKAVQLAVTVPGVKGVLAIKDDKMVVQGEIKLVPLVQKSD
ncbi:ApbE superfamily uncharacterized protein (UPF0280 family) [Desulfohalotomaculum tongense]|uniref:UPF0280 family protein n=1 Tax=Desulforadius tongensis TaxID=1216062 RepID=UPI00195B97BB|nr:UPF0280 family protein [Desulforadius tongensis]MBM7855398.1 ApbE superfamily uncharacterized protein (UPF0280 family) [Desulforadius tongensis]